MQAVVAIAIAFFTAMAAIGKPRITIGRARRAGRLSLLAPRSKSRQQQAPGIDRSMPRDGAIIFGDLGSASSGVLRIECSKCGPQYHVATLIERYGRNEKLFALTNEITADCPRKRASNTNEPCGAICPDLPKVV